MKTLSILLLVFFSANAIALGYTLPLPEGTIQEEDGQAQAEFNNTQFDLAIYRSSLSPEEIISFYKDNLTKEGFRLLTDDKKTKTLYFTHPGSDERFIIVVDDSAGDEVYIRVSHWYGNLPDYAGLLSEGKKKDIPGKDLAGIPRYPAAARLSSLDSGVMKTVTYQSDDSKKEVLSFYEEKMPSLGWEKLSMPDSARQKRAGFMAMPSDIAVKGQLYFTKKERFLTIMVQDACCGQKGTAISIVDAEVNE